MKRRTGGSFKKKKRTEGGRLLKTLGHRIESCKSRYSCGEEIVKHLRSIYPKYRRTNYRTFCGLVDDALQFSNNMEGQSESSSRKRLKNMEEEEEEEEEGSLEKKETLQMTRSSSNSVLVSEKGTTNDVNVRSIKKGRMFIDLGGMNETFKELKMIIAPMFNPKLRQVLGVKPIGGILLYGPPGCGKTRLAHAIASEIGCNFYPTSATAMVSGVTGGSENNIRELFSTAKRTAPSIIFIDEIDAISSKRDDLQRQSEIRIVTQIMTCMDEANDHSETSDESLGHVLVIGATNKPNDIDPALRRFGRFDREIPVGIPDESARQEILTVVTRNQKHDHSIDLQKIAASTPGFVGADLESLANGAGIVAMNRIINETEQKLSQDLTNEPDEDRWKKPLLLPEDDLEKCAITMSDFEEAAKMVQPSLAREGFSPIPNVKWEDVGALDHAKELFQLYILGCIKHRDDYKGFVKNLETGVLLYGPPGCGKTLIAKAVANEARANFIHVKGPELLNKFVGASEHEVRTIFSRARTCAPCIIFFDEVDALTAARGEEGGRVIEGVLTQLLIELDGADQRKGVFVIGATNRPGAMDPAVLRPGRFSKLHYVSLPSPDDRVKILKTLAKGRLIDASVDLSAIARMEDCENFSGADLAALMDEAGMAALIEKWTSTEKTSGTIKTCHFEAALSKVHPSVSKMQIEDYERFSKGLKKVREAKKQVGNHCHALK